MALSQQDFELALRQMQELAHLYSKDSAVVRLAQQFNQKRKAIKKQTKLFFRRMFHRPTPKPQDRLKLLVHIRGGIGDVCMARLFVVQLRNKFPTAQIDFCYDHAAVVNMVFSDGYIDGYTDRHYDPREYDLVIAGCHAFNFDYADTTRLQALAPDWIESFEKARALQQKIQIITQNTPHLDGLWAKLSVAYGSTRVANQGLTGGISVGQNDRAPIRLNKQTLENTLKKLRLSGQTYITIHDGTNNNTDLHGRAATRCWPQTHWQQFAKLFKAKYPHIKIVQIGGSNSVPFPFADICLIGKTQVADLPYILEASQAHIDGESGMVHLANLTSTRAVVMFGPSPLEYLSYSRNQNLRAGTCKNCMCIYADWMSRCPLFNENKCLQAITPQQVLQAADQILSSNN